MSEAQVRFNVAYLSILVGLFIQFGGVVWYASEMNARVMELGLKVDKVEANLKAETEKTAPVLFEYKFINSQLSELKIDVKDIKQALKR